jgi:hypothetical protein
MGHCGWHGSGGRQPVGRGRAALPDRPAAGPRAAHRHRSAEVQCWYARMLIDRNAPGDPSTGSGQDRDRARDLLSGAIAMYRRIGMSKHVEMA